MLLGPDFAPIFTLATLLLVDLHDAILWSGETVPRASLNPYVVEEPITPAPGCINVHTSPR